MRSYDPLDEVDWEDDDDVRRAFASEGSALRAASARNPRIHPCPTCGRENMLTPADVARHYQCNYCADAAERGF